MSQYNYAHTDFPNDVFNEDKLKEEIAADAAITTALSAITSSEAVDEDGNPTGNITVSFHFPTDLSGAEQTALGLLVAAHDGEPPKVWEVVHVPAPLRGVQAGATEVVANDRPAIEIEAGVTAFGAASFPWKKSNGYTKIRVDGHFILKQAGTGTKVRIGAKVKSQGVGEDSSAAFTPQGFSVVPVTHTLVGEVFQGTVELDASGIKYDDSFAVHIGRDGNNEMGAGDVDDVDVAIQILDVAVEVS
jgi:hypothetical protein